MAEGRDRDVDEAGVGRTQRVIADADAGERAGRLSLDEDIGGLREAAQVFEALRGIEVQDNGALVGVVEEVVVGALDTLHSIKEGPEMPQAASIGRLDANDAGAEVGEEPCGENAGFAGEVEDADVL